MEHVTRDFEFKPAYNVAKFFGDFIVSFNIEFGDDLEKTLSGYTQSGNKASMLTFDFLKQLVAILDCKEEGQSYHNAMFSLTKFHDIFSICLKRELVTEFDELFRDILADREVPKVVYSFIRKFQDWYSLKSADKEYCSNCQGRGFNIKNRPVAARSWAEALHG